MCWGLPGIPLHLILFSALKWVIPQKALESCFLDNCPQNDMKDSFG